MYYKKGVKMKEPRVNQSSIRYSDEVKDIVNSLPGATFGDRFEYCVLNYQETKADMEKNIENLEKEIKVKREELDKIYSEIYKYRDISYKIKALYDKL